MSDISAVNSSNKTNTLDSRSVSKVIYLGCSNTGTSENVITDIHPALLGQKNQDGGIAEVKAIQLSTIGNESIPKWTQDYDTELNQSVKYLKLSGISTPEIPRVIYITGDQNPDNFNDGGVFIPDAPTQTDDTGGSSKTVVTGLDEDISYIIASGLDHTVDGSPEYNDAKFILFPNNGRRIYIDSAGAIHICFTAIWGTTYPVALYAKSTDGGINWTVSRIDDSTSVYQTETCLAVDINGNIHFVWAERSTSSTTRRHIRYRKLSKSGTWGSVVKISALDTYYNYAPNIQIQRNGTTASITWSGMGYGSDHDGYNILYRTINSAGSLGTLTTLTTNATSDNVYLNATLDFDSNNYRHITYCNWDMSEGAVKNLYYIQETSGGLQSPIVVNTENADGVVSFSNVLVDKNNNIWVAYASNESAYRPLYAKRIINGTLGSRITVAVGGDGNPDWGSEIQLQVNEENNILVIYYTGLLVDLYHIRLKTIDQQFNVSSATDIYTTTSDYKTHNPNVAWSTVPTINSVIPNMPQHGIICLSIDTDRTDVEIGNLILTMSDNCIIGTPLLPQKMDILTTNIRGSVNTTSFNSAFKPAIT